MKILGITNLFPDTTRPGLAPFNRQQLFHLAEKNEIELIVPVPWPHRAAVSLRGEHIRLPNEIRERMNVHYPTYYYTPLIFRNLYGKFYISSIRKLFRNITEEFHPDLIYGTWAYPDCYAAAYLAREKGLPLVSRVHGSDVNMLAGNPALTGMIVEGMNYSKAVISVSAPLKEKLVEYGVDAEKVKVVLNGVDRTLFRKIPREEARRVTGIGGDAAVFMYAGNLKKGKGVSLLVEAARTLGDRPFELHIIGEGQERKKLERMIGDEEGKIFLHGRVAHDDMVYWYNSSDFFCLPSLAEGTPNVILEALSCSVPVLASSTGGIPEIVDGASGILFPPGDVQALADTLARAIESDWDRERVSCPAGSWRENVSELSGIFASTV